MPLRVEEARRKRRNVRKLAVFRPHPKAVSPLSVAQRKNNQPTHPRSDIFPRRDFRGLAGLVLRGNIFGRSMWKARMPPPAFGVSGGKWPLARDSQSSPLSRLRRARRPAGPSAPSIPPRSGFLPRCGVSAFRPCSARCHVSPECSPHCIAPCSPWCFPPSPSRARSAGKTTR